MYELFAATDSSNGALTIVLIIAAIIVILCGIIYIVRR